MNRQGLFFQTYWLTISWQYKMMKNIRKTLAGRIEILESYSLSKNKADGELFQTSFLPACGNGRQRQKNDIVDVFEHIWHGGIICTCEEVRPIDKLNCFIPCNLI